MDREVKSRSALLFVFLALVPAACAAPARPAALASPTPSPTPLPTLSPTPSPSPSPSPSPPPAIAYVAVGASDSVGVGASNPQTKSWPALIAARLPAGSEYRNVAVSGSAAAQAFRDQVPVAVARPATVATVWLAVNDLNAGVPPGAYARTLEDLIVAITTKTAAKVFVGNVPDLTLVPAYASADQARLRAAVADYNRAIDGVVRANASRVVLVDLFNGSDVLLREVLVAPDGFHPNDRGYQLIADRFTEVMKGAGVSLR